jgi:hypothetical protein
MNEKIHILRVHFMGETSTMHFLEEEKACNVAKEMSEMIKQDNGKLFKSTVVVTVQSEYVMDSIPSQIIKHILKGAYSEYTNGRSEN